MKHEILNNNEKDKQITSDAQNWWNFKSEDDQRWLMMKYGFGTPLDPKRVKIDEMVKMYKADA